MPLHSDIQEVLPCFPLLLCAHHWALSCLHVNDTKWIAKGTSGCWNEKAEAVLGIIRCHLKINLRQMEANGCCLFRGQFFFFFRLGIRHLLLKGKMLPIFIFKEHSKKAEQGNSGKVCLGKGCEQHFNCHLCLAVPFLREGLWMVPSSVHSLQTQ